MRLMRRRAASGEWPRRSQKLSSISAPGTPGADVVKALALGSDAILHGRPLVYGLALAGQRGVRHLLRCLLADFDIAVALAGCTGVRLDREPLTPAQRG